MIAIVDSGGANIASVRFALDRLGWEAELTADTERIREASHVILPGVGAAAAAMAKLRANGLDALIPRLTQPVLGVCLGMQLLFEGSDEGDTPCLGVIPGSARALTPAPGRPVPHMGWNRLRRIADSPLLDGIDDGAFCYFVHSYALPVSETTLMAADYGEPFSAIAAHGNFWAAQFHPERSAAVGARLLHNFLSL